ncbi:protein of unknown function (plasmid) [Cupriavidus taiwanensis]|uniref:Uncharacterized protein n=1 Tax=Cupriavidus taiwanensis TaxID=164546 RepID=A0A375I9Z7_9BURK|nr:hypothetical protein CT19425_U380026 [Cupriavidus taiwanensis]SPK77696.1 protein of unknown function [Cupriavidus taiwanensis]
MGAVMILPSPLADLEAGRRDFGNAPLSDQTVPIRHLAVILEQLTLGPTVESASRPMAMGDRGRKIHAWRRCTMHLRHGIYPLARPF